MTLLPSYPNPAFTAYSAVMNPDPVTTPACQQVQCKASSVEGAGETQEGQGTTFLGSSVPL